MATNGTRAPSEQSPAVYLPRRPADTVLYQIVAQHLETYLYLARQGDLDFDAVPEYVEHEFRKYLTCGILAHGLLIPSLGFAPFPGGWRENLLPAGFLPAGDARAAATMC